MRRLLPLDVFPRTAWDLCFWAVFTVIIRTLNLSFNKSNKSFFSYTGCLNWNLLILTDKKYRLWSKYCTLAHQISTLSAFKFPNIFVFTVLLLGYHWLISSQMVFLHTIIIKISLSQCRVLCTPFCPIKWSIQFHCSTVDQLYGNRQNGSKRVLIFKNSVCSWMDPSKGFCSSKQYFPKNKFAPLGERGEAF